MKDKWFARVTPKYIYMYLPSDFGRVGLQVGSLRINRKKQEIDKRQVSHIKPEDVKIFYERNKPFEELKEGADLVAKLLLQNEKLL